MVEFVKFSLYIPLFILLHVKPVSKYVKHDNSTERKNPNVTYKTPF